MIRLIQRRLIIPRGDTGSFNIPLLSGTNINDVAVFTIIDPLVRKKIFEKIIKIESDTLSIALSHDETVGLKPGKYLWDIKIYKDPQYLDDELINGSEVNSYYAGFSLPTCEIKETGDTFLYANDSETSLAKSQIDFINDALKAVSKGVEQTKANVSHYPIIQDEYWHIWDPAQEKYINTGINATGSSIESITNEEIDQIINEH